MNQEPIFTFGAFCLIRAQRLLLENNRPVRIGGRALDLLSALLERAGEVVSKEELISQAWPATVVEETSLRFHIASLRKLLGEGQDGVRYIANVSGRGYCFVEQVGREYAAMPGPQAGLPAHNLPGRLTRMVGRQELVDSLAELLPQRRFVTVVGAGGMGKSTLALALAERLLPLYPQGCWHVDLALVADAGQLPASLAAAIGLSPLAAAPDGMPQLLAGLREQRLLLLLDNCERLVDGAAELAEHILGGARGVHIVATSREALRARGEWVQHLPALALPPEPSAGIGAAQAMQFPALQLFVERAIASLDSFELTDADAAAACEICRRLDGMPLAIELAAARVDSFGVHGLLVQLDDRFPLLSQGRRAVPDRHRTLRALLDWSHDMLLPPERLTLRRLAVFPSRFTMAEAETVAADAGLPRAAVLEAVIALTAKSLIVIESDDSGIGYRLLDSTRAYALQQLQHSGEHLAVRHRLAPAGQPAAFCSA